MKKLYIVIVLFVVSVLGWVSSFNKNTKTELVRLENAQAQTKVVAPLRQVSQNAGVLKKFVVTGQNFSFEPSMLSVNKGDKVQIIFKNTAGFHDFRIDEFNTSTKRSKAPSEEVIEFVADKAGTFEYYCSVGTHRSMGMKGSLVVS